MPENEAKAINSSKSKCFIINFFAKIQILLQIRNSVIW